MDKDYWNQFWQKPHQLLRKESSFAHYVMSFCKKRKSILDLGCGNCRDSLYFAKQGLFVDAIDQSVPELVSGEDDKFTLNLIKDDFTRYHYKKKYDYLYSRFSIHALSYEEEKYFFDSILRLLVLKGSLFFIETRSIHDPLFKKGTEVGHNTNFFNNHLRRFIDSQELTISLEKHGFKILSCVEDHNISIYHNDNPILIRIVAEYNGN